MKTDKETRKEELFQLLQDAENGEQVERSKPKKKQAGKTQQDVITEQNLIAQCRSENRKIAEVAFRQLIQRYQGNVYTYVFYNVDDDKAASKTTRDVFVQAHKGISEFHGETSVNVWLLKITEEQLRNVSRKWDTRPQQPADTDQDFPDGPPSGGTECQDIRNLLSAYVEDELSESEIPRVETHLDVCTQCWLEYEELKETLDFPVHTYDPIHAPEDLAHQILQTLFPKPSLWEQCRSFLTQFVMGFSVAWPQIVTVAAAAIIFIGMPYYYVQRERIYQLEHDLLIVSEDRGTDAASQELLINTVVIFTGEFASKELSEKALDYAADILPELKKLDETTTQIIGGNLREIGDNLVKNIRTAHGTILYDNLEPNEDNLIIRKITAIIPKNSNAFVSLLLRQSTPQPSETEESPDIRMVSVTFYIIDKH